MLDGLIQWSLRNRLVVLALAAAFLVWGGYVATRMPVDVLPNLTAPTVTVLVEGHGMAPTDMEALVTFPIEAALNGASGVRRVRSATAVGIAVIWVDFDWEEDIYRARQTVTEKLTAVVATLPDEVEPPVLAPLSSIMGEIMFIALESVAHTPLELRTTAETLVRRRLLATPGVSQVTVIGGERRQFEVLVDPERLADYGVALSTVEDALRGANRNTSAGFRLAGGRSTSFRASDVCATSIRSARRSSAPATPDRSASGMSPISGWASRSSGVTAPTTASRPSFSASNVNPTSTRWR